MVNDEFKATCLCPQETHVPVSVSLSPVNVEPDAGVEVRVLNLTLLGYVPVDV